MAKTKITGKLALQLLEEVVAEKGAEYVYPTHSCEYVRDGQPSCLVGHVLVRAGVAVESVKELDLLGSIGYAMDPAHEFLPADYPLSLTPKARRILDAAQAVQDGRGRGMGPKQTWGEALEEARRVK